MSGDRAQVSPVHGIFDPGRVERLFSPDHMARLNALLREDGPTGSDYMEVCLEEVRELAAIIQQHETPARAHLLLYRGKLPDERRIMRDKLYYCAKQGTPGNPGIPIAFDTLQAIATYHHDSAEDPAPADLIAWALSFPERPRVRGRDPDKSALRYLAILTCMGFLVHCRYLTATRNDAVVCAECAAELVGDVFDMTHDAVKKVWQQRDGKLAHLNPFSTDSDPA